MLKEELAEPWIAVTDQDFVLTIMNGADEEFGEFVSATTGKVTIDKITPEGSMTIKEKRWSQIINESKIC